MAMYYYASKISAIACGTRSEQSTLKKSRGQRDRDKYLINQTSKQFVNLKDLNFEKMDIHYNHKVSSPIKSQLYKNECTSITVSETNVEETSSPSLLSNKIPIIQKSPSPNLNPVYISGGLMYENGKIVSGELECLFDVLIKNGLHHTNQDFVFSFLLSSRLFIRPYDLLGKLLLYVADTDDLLEPLVDVLAIWTNKFPYDFRDERIMGHVKHIVSRCANTGLEDIVSELLSALLQRLTDLEKHEENLRACQTTEMQIDSMKYPAPAQIAQILCRVERKLGKHIGPEEFIQCSYNVLLDKQTKTKWQIPLASGGPPGTQDPKKTCNLETYLDWSIRLRLFVCNKILQCQNLNERSKIVEFWCGVAQYCLLVGNYNSAISILESLESPPIARLKLTWEKLSATCQQLECMQRHAEGHADLWAKQTTFLRGIQSSASSSSTTISVATESKALTLEANLNTGDEVDNLTMKTNEWVVSPVLSDIVKITLIARECCLQKLPNDHINIVAFDRLAAIVGAFTKHMNEIKSPAAEYTDEYQQFSRHMQLSTSFSESELMMASFDCEEPTQAETLMYDLS